VSQFTVPQFIDVEDKILGPLTVRQFVILLIMGGVDFLLFKLADFTLFLVAGIPIFGFSVTLAFVRINGQPFHYYMLNLLQYSRRPKLKIWDKTLVDQELREYLEEKPPAPPPQRIRKEALTTSRLSEVSLIVNTGGVYRPEEWEAHP
jgi:hypothetical protein